MSTPKNRMPTITEVAAAAGVSRATVSRTFSRPEFLNPETTARVRTVGGTAWLCAQSGGAGAQHRAGRQHRAHRSRYRQSVLPAAYPRRAGERRRCRVCGVPRRFGRESGPGGCSAHKDGGAGRWLHPRVAPPRRTAHPRACGSSPAHPHQPRHRRIAAGSHGCDRGNHRGRQPSGGAGTQAHRLCERPARVLGQSAASGGGPEGRAKGLD